jgi:hypothetical protein
LGVEKISEDVVFLVKKILGKKHFILKPYAKRLL